MSISSEILVHNLASRGVGISDATFCKAAAEELRENYGAADIGVAASVACAALEFSGRKGSPAHVVYAAVTQDPSPDPFKRKLASIVFRALGKCQGESMVREATLSKAATPGVAAGLAKRIGGTALGYFPALFRSGITLGVGAGALAGGGLWAARRGLTRQEHDMKVMEAKRDLFIRLAREVEDELARRKLEPTPENVAAAVEYLT